ncbi:hypothetical protein RvY_18886 [Ramazzottius varieornatus]|uniref:ABC1 atypical kinase-like domain-containing protein n=1 Tax=Ramazzottius varieornatus TaxID=947166 RepID=A0A1D1W8S4_RAMVA|nr:hypothetical protein RvY_18886 [Ramazzottius varieornatus]
MHGQAILSLSVNLQRWRRCRMLPCLPILWASRRKAASVMRRWLRNGTVVRWSTPLSPRRRTYVLGFALGTIQMPFSAAMASYDHSQLPAVLPTSRKIARREKERRGAMALIMRQPWMVLVLSLRCIRLGLMYLPLLIVYPLMIQTPALKMLWLRALLKAFEWSGPTFMKFGQWMSTRRDIFSPQLCAVFSSLHRSTPPHSFRSTKRRMKAAFGSSWKEYIVFEGANPRPIGSGCVGQVYKVKVDMAKLKTQSDDTLALPSGQANSAAFAPFDITPCTALPLLPPSSQAASTETTAYVDAALKILHPNIHYRVNRDLIILEVGATILEFLFKDLKWLRIRDSVIEFGSLMNRQLDLRVEAQNLLHFHRNFAHFPSVRFPLPHFPFVSQGVLLESWEEGIPIGDFVDKQVPPMVRKELASIGVEVLLKMTFIDNFVHADMHPGNLMVRNVSGSSSKEAMDMPAAKLVYEDVGDVLLVGMQKASHPFQLVILDAGLTASLSQYDFDSFRGVFAAVVRGAGDVVADKFLFHAAADACTDRVAFKKELSKLVHEARSKELSLSQVDVGELLQDLFSILVKYQVKLESNFISIMLGIMVLEGLGRSLDPDLDLLEKARPVLLRKMIF